MGIFGLADMLIKYGAIYGSIESIKLCQKIGKTMIETAIDTSAELAKKKGAFKECNPEEIVSTPFFQQLQNGTLKEKILTYGLRNSQLLTIAPTGTLSTMLGVSGGIEPIYANYYTRKTESLHGEDRYYKVYTPIVKAFMEEHHLTNDTELPNFFVTAATISYQNRIDMQSTWQSFIDASISSTINVPENFTMDQVEYLYQYAYQKGLKGVTIFRDNCKRIGVLTTSKKIERLVPNSRKVLGTLD